MSQDSVNKSVIVELRELVDDDDPDFLNDLLRGYAEEIDRSLPELAALIAAAETVKVAKTAHTLKGASSNVGAPQMARLFKELELAANAPDWSAASRLLQELRQEFQEVQSVLNTLL